MERLQKKILLLLNLSLMALFLTGCPMPVSNKSFARGNKSGVLPYTAMPDQALVYIVQPYTIVDWYLVGGAASDGDVYSSQVYLKSATRADYAYIGKLDNRNNLCFYIKPGQYSLKFKNRDSTPATIEQPLSLTANSIRVLALERTSYTGGINNMLKFQELSLAEGKGYIDPSNTSGCAHMSTLPISMNGEVSVVYSVTFRNEASDVWAVYSKRKVADESVAELLRPGDSYTYGPQKVTVPTNKFLESGLSVYNSLQLRKIESSDKKFQDSKETILNNPLHENANAYIDIVLPQNKLNVNVYFNPFPTIRTDTTCQLLKPVPDARVSCVVEIRDKSSAPKKGRT